MARIANGYFGHRLVRCTGPACRARNWLPALLILLLGGCATTPALEQDCADFFTEEKEVAKCKKRVQTNEKKEFKRHQEEANKEKCRVSKGVWIIRGRFHAYCGDRRDVEAIKRIYSHRYGGIVGGTISF